MDMRIKRNASISSFDYTGFGGNGDALIPCEFCEETFPVEELMQHQVAKPSSDAPDSR